MSLIYINGFASTSWKCAAQKDTMGRNVKNVSTVSETANARAMVHEREMENVTATLDTRESNATTVTKSITRHSKMILKYYAFLVINRATLAGVQELGLVIVAYAKPVGS
jgi:hypothetical protein